MTQLGPNTVIRHQRRTPAVSPVQVTRGEKGDTGAPGGSDASFASFVGDPASATRAQLSATYGRSPAIVNFAARAGVDPTGATASDAALDTLLAAATPSAPVCIEFAEGTYRFDTAKTIDPAAVALRSSDDGNAVLDFSHLTTGPALTIGQRFSRMERETRPLAGLTITGPTTSGTTVDGIRLGDATPRYANRLLFEQVQTRGFRDQWVLDTNCYLDEWRHCTITAADRYGIKTDNIPNAFENMLFSFCLLSENGAASAYIDHLGATFHFLSCSFDYSEQDLDIRSGMAILTDCYLEANDTAITAATERIVLRPTRDSTGPVLKIKGGSVWPFWTAAGTTGSFIRITGDTSTVKSNASVSIQGTLVRTDPLQTLRYLIRDDRTPYSGTAGGSTVDKFSEVTVNDLTYKGIGGSYGQYGPLVYRDVEGTEHRLDPGIMFGRVGDRRGTATAWQWQKPNLIESIPRLLAVDRKQITSGDLYILALPRTGPHFRASAADLLMALGATGTSITYARLGIYDGGRNYAPTDLAQFLSAGLVLNSGAESIKVANVSGATIGWPPNQLIYLGLLVVSTGIMPSIYGRIVSTATNPLLDPQSTTAPMFVGKLAGQTALPTTVTRASLTNVDFVPWLGIRPTVYS